MVAGWVLVTISITTACVAFSGPSDIPIPVRLSSVHSAGAHRQGWLSHRFPASDRHIPAQPNGYAGLIPGGSAASAPCCGIECWVRFDSHLQNYHVNQ